MTQSNYTRARRIFPPFSRDIKIHTDNPTVFVCLGNHGWERAKQLRGRSLVLPAGKDPAAFKWPVYGCGSILLDYAGIHSVAERLAGELMRWGATCVIHADFPANDTQLLRGDWRI